MTIVADDSVRAGELAIAYLSCEHCQKELPREYFVHAIITDVK